MDIADIVPDEQEQKERARRRHERVTKMCEGKSARYKRRMARVEAINRGREVARVRVVPKNEEYRKFMVHPAGNIAFRETGSMEWPLDQFTLRRLRDGDVTLDQSQAQPVKVQRQAPSRPTRAAQSPASTPPPHESR